MQSKSFILQGAALFLMLAVLPAGSWYYLKAGFNYQLAARAELKDYGPLAFDSATAINDKSIDKAAFQENIAVFNFLNTNENIDKQLALLKKLNLQFQDEKVLFMTYDIGGNMTAIQERAEALDLLDADSKIWFVNTDATAVTELLQSIQKPDFSTRDADGKMSLQPLDEELSNYPYFVLSDTNLEIKNFYDYQDENQIKRLVEHLAMVMPREKQMKPEIYREKEK